MRWGNTEQARPLIAEPLFAAWPTRLKDGSWLWLERVWVYRHAGEATGINDYYADPPPDFVRNAYLDEIAPGRAAKALNIPLKTHEDKR